MEGSWKTRAFWIALLAIPICAGVWAWASYSVKDRIADFARRAGEVGHARGGRFPTESEVRAKVEADAAELGLTISDLQVTFTRGAHSRAGAMIEQRLAKASLAEGMPPIPHRPRVVETRIDVAATVRGRALLWSVGDTIRSSTVLTGEPPGGGD